MSGLEGGGVGLKYVTISPIWVGGPQGNIILQGMVPVSSSQMALAKTVVMQVCVCCLYNPPLMREYFYGVSNLGWSRLINANDLVWTPGPS